MENLLKPIGRLTYVLGIIVMLVINVLTTSFFIAPGLVNGSSNAKGNALFLIFLMTLILTIWDYKRMKDIFIEKKYEIYIWSIIIFIQVLFFITNPLITPLLSKTQVSFLGLVFVAFSLFLVFKKGHPDSVRHGSFYDSKF